MNKQKEEKIDFLKNWRKNTDWIKEKQRINKMCADIHKEFFGYLYEKKLE